MPQVAPAIAAIGSLVLGAVGTGISVYGQQQAAKASEQFNALNMQAELARTSMQSRTSIATAALNEQQQKNQADAATQNANAIRLAAQQKDQANKINIARQQEDHERFLSMMRARGGASGTVGSTGSALELLGEAASLQALERAEMAYQGENERQRLMYEAQGVEAGAEYASIQAGLTRMEGQATASAYRAQGVQAQIKGLAGIQAARGAYLNSYGTLATGLGGGVRDYFGLRQLGAFS